jgi:periplasmic protein TonB
MNRLPLPHDPLLARWGGALMLVLAVHGGLIAGILVWAAQSAPASPPPAALMIDLAPPAPPIDQPPQVKPPEPEPPKPQKVERRPKPPTPKKAELAVNTTPEKPAEPQSAAQESVPPQSVAAPTAAAAAAAPAQGPASITPQSNALPTWQGALLAHLEKHKRYPRAAQLRRQQGVSHVAFTIDRQGRVLVQRLHQGSGHDSLDQETLDLLQRAQPLPPPPVEIAGDRIDLLVPVQFFLK